MFRKYTVHITFLIAGAIIGFLVFHPYTMFVYSLVDMPGHEGQTVPLRWDNLFTIARTTFAPTMLPMAISFVFLSGIIGILIGILIEKKRRLDQKRIALETLNRLMVTLSHYLLNANTIIGGMAGRCKRTTPDKDILCSDVIVEQAKKIDAVIKALKGLTEIKTADYTTKGKALMIDVASEIEARLNKAEEKGLRNPD